MSNHTNRQGVNPLRPYYIPPTIGDTTAETPNIPGPNAFSRPSAPGTSSGKYASKARDIFSDLDYKDYISEPSPSVVRSVKDIVDELIWKYTSVFLAQPFEAAKLLLQVRTQDDIGALGALPVPVPTPAASKPSSFKTNPWTDDLADSGSEGDEPAYFTTNVPHTPSPVQRRRRRSSTPPPESPKTIKKPELPAHMLNIRRPDSITEVMGQLWQREGAWGTWKGTNITFVYTVLQSLLENWSRSLLSALFDVPDLGLKTDMDRLVDLASPYPWAALGIAAAAAVVTSLILSPLDLVRTRSIITSTTRGPRRTLALLRSLPSYLCPPSLVLPTIMHSLVHPVLALSTPLVLRTKFMINSEISPTTFSFAKFSSSTVALFLKLPVETVLRRGQVAVLAQPQYIRAVERAASPSGKAVRSSEDKATATSLETIVQPGRYDGVFGTMYTIVNDEGSRAVPTAAPVAAAKGRTASKKGKPGVAETVYRRGQGVEGLWRGWKVNWWGLVGLWTAAVVGGGGDGEF
ncbi:Mitochondrial fusion and transport protein ugo1 [Cytospora mali]|uniref:Mitochondrial fusion and transport protein ugo1 n=1 Tax=Cytospora mali TaxID=578113 RepID=A0A194W3R4_CYTMA|nr:Mitochondrial fusion and transport protein ugo1 [Valsa mali]